MTFCLLPEKVDQFKKALRDREIDPAKLATLGSLERRALLEKFVGPENSQQVNALFESKLLIKNQQAGMISWARKVSGMSPQAKRDLVTKIEKLDRVLDPKEGEQFLNDLASTKLGADVTQEEAQKITELSRKISDLRDKVTDKKSRIEYGNAILDLHDYTESITKKPMSLVGNIVNVANLPRSLMSSLDFSAPFRQGFGMVGHPKEFAKAFGSMFKYAASKGAYKDLMADIVTRDTYDLMKSGGLRITKLDNKLSQREEAFMSSLVDKVPGMAASERAYTGFLNKIRADVFDKMIARAEANGENITKGSQVIKDIASVTNDFTGSGNLGKNDRYSGAVPLLNTVFFSPRKMAATINIFNPVNYAKLSPTARGFAIRNLVSMLGFSALVLTLAKASGAKVETDPNSSDFGKAVIGDTHIDVTGGNANYVVLLSRLISGKTKSSISEITSDLNGNYASSTRADVLTRYIRNKLSPTASFIADFLYGKDSLGNAFNAKTEALSRVIPLTIQGMIEGNKNDPSNNVFGSILSTFGAGVQTYGTGTDWNTSTGKELTQFKQKVGDSKFKEANDKYNQEYDKWLKATLKNPKYINLSDEDKGKVLTTKKADIKEKIFKEYRFTYKQQKSSKLPKF
jgi:hypothetical protein